MDGQLYFYLYVYLLGKKLDLIRKHPKATFEMDCEHRIILYKERMSCTMGYASVIGHGTIEFVDDEYKYDALKILMRHYHSEAFPFNTDLMKATTVFCLKVQDMVGKRRDNWHHRREDKDGCFIGIEQRIDHAKQL